MVTLLAVNGISLTYAKGELAALTLAVANDEISFDDIVQSIKEHSVNG